MRPWTSPAVTVVKVETRKELRSTVTSSGEVRPVQFMNLTSEVQGRIEDIYVKEGDHVTKGQPLVKPDSGEEHRWIPNHFVVRARSLESTIARREGWRRPP